MDNSNHAFGFVVVVIMFLFCANYEHIPYAIGMILSMFASVFTGGGCDY